MTSSCKVDAQSKGPYYEVHPFEIGFSGFSGSGKTTLIEKLIPHFSKDHLIACLKSDAHRVAMDQPGKDTYRYSQAGAQGVYIHSDSLHAHLHQPFQDSLQLKSQLKHYDLVFIEGWKSSTIPKFLFVDEAGEMLSSIQTGSITDVIALVGTHTSEEFHSQNPNNQLPYFNRDQLQEIIQFIKSYYQVLVNSTPLFGLVLAGGKSSRMGQDKAQLNIQSQPMAVKAYELLEIHCQEVFLSRNPDQDTLNIPDSQVLNDQYLDMGPLSGILSAMHQYPNAAWLVVACDLPLLDEATLQQLCTQRDPYQFASCFIDSQGKFPEPLCTIYEPKSFSRLLEFVAQGYRCPRKMLINSEVKTLDLFNKNSLTNTNTPEDFQKIQDQL